MHSQATPVWPAYVPPPTLQDVRGCRFGSKIFRGFVYRLTGAPTEFSLFDAVGFDGSAEFAVFDELGAFGGIFVLGGRGSLTRSEPGNRGRRLRLGIGQRDGFFVGSFRTLVANLAVVDIDLVRADPRVVDPF